MRVVAMVAAALIVSGCAQPPAAVVPQVPISLGTQFNAAEARALLADGVNMIKGSAFMRQRGGGVVTCAGSVVNLLPATEYTKRRFRFLYRTEGDTGSNARRADVKFDPDPPEYQTLLRTTRCDAQGNFTFDRVADGEFFVQTTVAWQVAGRLQGGNLMHRVRVNGGQAPALVLSE